MQIYSKRFKHAKGTEPIVEMCCRCTHKTVHIAQTSSLKLLVIPSAVTARREAGPSP